MMRLLSLIALLLALASCQVLGGDDDEDGGGGDNGGQSSLVQWDRNPNTIVFRADVVGGEDAFYRRNEVPDCTIYGDNHIVWRNTLADNSIQILYDILPDAVIARFITDLVGFGIYGYEAGADLLVPSNPAPVIETLRVNVNGIDHRTDAFGGWDYTYYEQIVNLCRNLSQTPVIYEPSAGWVSALEVPYDTNRVQIYWDAGASGLDIAALAASGQPQWITGDNLRILWNIVVNNLPGVQLGQGELNYFIALQVPNVMRDAPPAPES
jgi:hypothetical protein